MVMDSHCNGKFSRRLLCGLLPTLLIPVILSGCWGKKTSSGEKGVSSVASSSVQSSMSSQTAVSSLESTESKAEASKTSAGSASSSSSQEPTVAETSVKVLTLPATTKENGKLLAVKNIQQMPELKSGCEITSAAMVLQYFGYSVSKIKLASYLKCDSSFQQKDGKTFGPNPWSAFVGSPDQDRYGCYAPVIKTAVNRYLDSVKAKHRAYDITGTSVEKLYDLIDKGVPVIVWATSSMKEPSLGTGWYLNDTKEFYQWIEGEHCMVLTGYTDTKAVFSNPNDERGTVAYDRSLFEQRYQDLYEQAVVIV